MAQLVLGVAGAIIGSVVPGVGTQLGYALGSMLGSALDPPDAIRQEGPRMSDLKVTNSNYGQGIPLVFGTVRIAGNLIWSTDIKETKTTTSEGGKGGGPEVESTTYSYSVSSAIAICRGQAQGIRRVWADGKLVYDKSDTNTGATTTGFKFEFFAGSETQDPSTTIEAVLGVGNVPAYRGICYIVCEDMPLGDFGNRIPNFTFEIIRSESDVETSQSWIKKDSDLAYDSSYIIQDKYDSNYIYKLDYINSGDTLYTLKLHKINAYSNEIVSTLNFPKSYFSNHILNKKTVLLIASDEYTSTGLAFKSVIYIINKMSMSIEKRISNDTLSSLEEGLDYGPENSTKVNFNDNYGFLGSDENGINYCITHEIGSVDIYGKQDIYAQIVAFDDFGNLKKCYFTVIVKDLYLITWHHADNISSGFFKDGYFYFPCLNGIDHKIYLTRINLYNGGVEYILKLHDVVDEYDLGYGNEYVGVYDNTYNKYFVPLYPNSGVGNIKLLTIDIETNIIELETLITNGNGNFKYQKGDYDTYKDFESIKMFIYTDYTQTRDLYSFNALTHTYTKILETDNPYNDLYMSSEYNYIYHEDSGKQFFIETTTGKDLIIYNGKLLALGKYNLQNVVNELCVEAGLQLTELDTIDLNDDLVNGFVIGNTCTARTALEQLATIYNFGVVETDWELKFKKNNQASSKTINYTEVSAKTFSNNLTFDSDLTTQRKQEQELPRTINVNYFDLDKDYTSNTQESKRQTVKSTEITNIELPIVLTATEAKQVADRLMYEGWISRDSYTFETNLDYIEVEPSDVITFTKNNQTYNIRIVAKEEDVGIIKFKGVANNSAVYTQVSTGETGLIIDKRIETILDSLFAFLDIPILLDTDDNAGVYVGSGALDTGYRGSVLYASEIESGNYNNIATFTTSIKYGYTSNLLSNFSGGNITDFQNSLTIVMKNGVLTSITRDELLNFGNLALVGNEIIQFKNATLVDTNTYKLTGLLRGRFGTEQYLSTHNNNEQFILLEKTTLQRINTSISNYNQNKYYKNVSFGSSLNATIAQQKLQQSIGLKPYSIINLESSRAATLDINATFDVRGRGMCLLKDNTDIVDFDGDTYEVEIWNSTYTTKKRTIYAYTNSFTYTSAEQIEDFGSNQATVYVKIYKTNNRVGKGFEFVGTVGTT